MFNRRGVIPLLLLAAIVVGGAADGQPPQSEDTTRSVADGPASEPTKHSDITAEQAVRAALSVFDRLDSGDGSDMTIADAEGLDRSIEIVRTKDPSHPWLPYLSGRAYALVGRKSDAINYLRKFVSTREGRNEWRAHRVLGDLFVNDYPKLAEMDYETADRLKQNEPTVLFGLSQCAYKLGDNDEAVRLARNAVAADGRRTIRYVRHLAQMLMAQRRWAEALREAQQALRLAQEAASSRKDERTPLQVVDAQYAMLIEILRGRLAESSGAADDHVQLATLIRRRAENAVMVSRHDVLAVLENGVKETSPNTPFALRQQYAVTLAEVGRRDEAIAEFETLLTADPGNAVISKWLNRLRQEQTGSDQPRKP